MLAAMTDGENDVGLARSLQSNTKEISLFSPRNVVGRFVYLDDPGSYTSWDLVGSTVSGRFLMKGQGNCITWPSRLGVGQWVNVLS